MTYFIEIKETPESKSLIAQLRTLKYVKIRSEEKHPKRKYHFTDEEMALPLGKKPNRKELEQWLTRPDKDKGCSAETVRKRLVKKLHKEFSTKK